MISKWECGGAWSVGEVGTPERNQCITPHLHINELGPCIVLLLVCRAVSSRLCITATVCK